MIALEVAGDTTGQRRIGIVDELHHFLHLVPLCKAQSDIFRIGLTSVSL